MSANPRPPVRHVAGHTLRPMTLASLEGVVALENEVYAFPWTRGNFVDSLAAGYLAEVLVAREFGVLGYYVAMTGVDEMHLLNLTVGEPWEGRGFARAMLDALDAHCRRRRLAMLWLEVRTSNARARALYARRGFAEVGVRRAYYPAPHGAREDAIVMSARIGPEAPRGVD